MCHVKEPVNEDGIIYMSENSAENTSISINILRVS
jgi:hypothetical protein